jgi:hypothetical protein
VGQHALTAALDTWPWPDSMDALVAAPGFNQRLLESE